MKRSRLYLIASIIVLLSLSYIGYSYAVDSAYRISSEDAKDRLRKNEIDLILDVRTDVERSSLGYYPGSVHIQSSDLELRMPREYPNKNLRILSYCNTGHRARLATDKLHALGYKNAVYISSTYGTLL